MTYIVVSPLQLKSALIVAAKNDIRYYLNGVLIESKPGVTRVVATDGHRLYAHDYEHGDNEQGTFSFILPRDIVELAVKSKSPAKEFWRIDVTKYNVDEANKSVSHAAGRLCAFPTELSFTAIDGVFPDYCRVMPKAESGVCSPAQFNTDYLADFTKIQRLTRPKALTTLINQTGPDGCGWTSFSLPHNHRAIGVVMPIRAISLDVGNPDVLDSFKSKL